MAANRSPFTEHDSLISWKLTCGFIEKTSRSIPETIQRTEIKSWKYFRNSSLVRRYDCRTVFSLRKYHLKRTIFYIHSICLPVRSPGSIQFAALKRDLTGGRGWEQFAGSQFAPNSSVGRCTRAAHDADDVNVSQKRHKTAREISPPLSAMSCTLLAVCFFVDRLLI